MYKVTSTSPRRMGRRTAGALITLSHICTFIWVTLPAAGAYNIDESSPMIFQGPSGSLFGYSVILHSYGTEKWMIVGAPKANQTTRPNISNPGGIFKCKIGDNINGSCEAMDVGEQNGAKCGRTCIVDQDDQWLGVSMSRQQTKDGELLVCGHRWKNVHYEKVHKLPHGICYKIPANLRTDLQNKICPCYRDYVKTFGEHYGSCQAGISTFYLEDLIIMGAPGSFFWMGSIFVYNTTQNKIYTYDNKNNTVKYGSYLGYAVGAGHFMAPNSNDIIAGAPQQEQIGKVFIFAMEGRMLIMQFEAEGKQLGSYFGASVCAVDLNGDGLSDLLVGAPMQSTVREEGRVYVYMNAGEGRITELEYELSGSDLYAARFGEAITNLGDLDNDGFEDVAIGAPQEENLLGAIYIYNGREKGITRSFTQRIQGKTFGYSLNMFGQSISQGLDADGNGYQDVAVGAFLSDSAVLLRTRPVVTIDASLKLPNSVNRTKFECVENGHPAVCMNVTICFKYRGRSVPGHIVLHYNISSDVKRKSGTPARFYFSSNGTSDVYLGKIELYQKFANCKIHQAFMRRDVRDILTPIHMESRYYLGRHIVNKRNTDELKPLLPILQRKDGEENVLRNVVSFARYCALENCSADLQISGKVSFPGFENKTYVAVGGMKTIMVNISLFNAGDDAYQSNLQMKLPRGLFFTKVLDLLEKQINCAIYEEENQRTRLECTIGHLYVDSLSKQEFSFLFDASSLSKAEEDLLINVTVNCQNEVNEASLWNNEAVFIIPTRYEVNVNVLGSASPVSFVYGPPDDEKIICIKEKIDYTFKVINVGPSLVPNAVFEIRLPNTFAPSDIKLFQILDVKTTTGSCYYHTDTKVCDIPPTNKTIFNEFIDFFSRSGKRLLYCYREDPSCIHIACPFGDMEVEHEAIVEVKVETNHALLEMEISSFLQFMTTAAVTFGENRRVINLHQQQSGHVLLEAVHNQKPRSRVIYTIIGISLVFGLLLFSLMTYILWKIGFFKRKYKMLETDTDRKESWSFLTQDKREEQ
ncbi:integrin alpha-4 [Rana temporaria]|uniref:integrin alpha-4 n=1 Tax=Rana temporaria TaxID=8407 RepID=UPI001AAD2707|nr:integrin alpha-4 [Rana temporaria]